MEERRTRRNFDELGERRREAMTLLDEGVSQADVARELGVSRQTVSRWARLKEAYPENEPWRRRALGRPGGLTEEQKALLARRLVDSYVRELGPRGRSSPKRVRWTLARVAGMIETEFGVSYSLAHVRNILIAMVGGDHLPLSNVRFWARVIELAYPEWSGRVLVKDLDEDWALDGKIIGELRRRLQR
ncbi:helix-turn-helix domain-containing protein [Paraburkholderia sp. BL21I4N1]|uniref:helix-turn-helix domain-containing protein n=1 Tax=Paraburkholderia sp. BL21I4N1 TaxID=1938801 RepID=UPI000CFC8FB3|nr:helix-turn-helix domain-containing protein [Paraburkholderia sp. BL21I4N1]PQV52174.1 transposase [Paraburkholderia sp. BL21I4N1]